MFSCHHGLLTEATRTKTRTSDGSLHLRYCILLKAYWCLWCVVQSLFL